MIEYFVYISQLVLTLSAFFITYLLLKQNKQYVANQLLALSLGLVGMYAFFLFLYKVLKSAVLMQYSIRIGFSALILAVFLLYLTIQVLMYSKFVFKTKRIQFAIFLGIAIIVICCMVFTNWIMVENNDIGTMEYVDWVFYLFAGYIAYMLISSMIYLYFWGIRKTKGSSKKHMISFLWGLFFMVLGLVTEGVGGVFIELAGLFDLLLFVFLSIGAICMANAFLGKNRQNQL